MKKQINKKSTLARLKKFVNHRFILMEEFGAVKTASKMKTVTYLNNRLEYLKGSPAEKIPYAVLLLQPYIENIMPGEKSKFYKGAKKMIDEIMNECKKTISI